MEVKFTRSKWGTILWGVASAVLGIFMFVNPGATAKGVTVFFGWVLTIAGVIALIGSFTHWSIVLSTLDLYAGALSLLFGMLILAWPEFFVAFIFVMLGLYVIAAGFSTLAGSNALRILGVKGSGAGIALSVLSVILGILVIMSPFAMASFAMSVGGIALIYTGLVHIAQGIKMPGKGN
ncbi:hypothetical protein HF885_05505 [Olsenella umbonata]|uniref:Acid-resistance membrane protein n=1 Tax=Parafannyhessea umbonata TaxID=604330 RepID=A0A7X9TAS1_9ACTN|nr:DUF308 domain-containing protein [Parafannyhessea umbonata]NMF25890.1 hypothetical protein [Parafannyhessea umbonata]